MTEKPIIMMVDSNAIDRDTVGEALRGRYGDSFHILLVSGQAEAIEALPKLNAPIALAFVDLHLADGDGTAVLAEVRKAQPAARLVLMVSLSDSDAAIEAINTIGIHRYAVTPFLPYAERLFPILDDVLFDWHEQVGDGVHGVRILGNSYSARAYQIKDVLTRNLIPFRWFDLATDPEGRQLAEDLGLPQPWPTTVLLDDGQMLLEPKLSELFLALKLTQPASRTEYDLVVIGGGPAGLAASVYGACEGYKVLVIEDDAPGGQAGSTSVIENYLGFPSGLSGADLAQRALVQAKRFGVEWLSARRVTSLRIDGDKRFLQMDDGTEVTGRAVLIATGMTWRKLPTPGLAELENAGVYYGASIGDAVLCAGEDIFMIGGGNSAGQAALHFAEHARSVTLLIRTDSLRKEPMSAYLVDRIEAHARINVRVSCELAEAQGQGRIDKLVLKNLTDETLETVPASRLYIMVGTVPCSEFVAELVGRDDFGFILTDRDVLRRPAQLPLPWTARREPYLMETSVPGVFAAGDVRADTVKRVGSAVGQGAVAIAAIGVFLKEEARSEDRAPAN